VCEADEFRDFRWRTRERDVFRELNKSPFIAYPIKETVNTIGHKASLLLQVALGGVDLSDVPDAVRRQITLDTSLLFERMHRLVRAVIECKASDFDGTTCRIALDLARSMAARAWEGKPMQLTQVAHVGPVFTRKFVSHGITTVRGLAEAGASNIERILSRNPPFGKKVADDLAHFPRLTLEARIATEDHRALGSALQPVVRVDTMLGFSNTLGKPKWRGKIPSVTFMAETTEGVLAYFWRGSMKKFRDEDDHKLSLQFEVEVSSIDEEIVCHFACEDIVGTVVTRRLKHSLPASAFSSKKQLTSLLLEKSNQRVTSLTDDDIGDSDLLEITQRGGNHSKEPIVILEDSDIDAEPLLMDRFGHDLVNDMVPSQEHDPAASQYSANENVPWQPIQLPNGKYKCNHRCADFGLKNGNGKPCAHRCCRFGLDVPRKPRRSGLKRKAGMETVAAEPAPKVISKPSAKKPKATPPDNTAPNRSTSQKPLVSTYANRGEIPLLDIDDFDLDGEGLVDLTQVEGAYVGDLQIPKRSLSRVEGPTSNAGSHDDDVSLFEGISDDALQDDLVPSLERETHAKGQGSGLGTKTNKLQADFVKTQSNSTGGFSGGSIFGGIVLDECNAPQSPPCNYHTNASSAFKKVLRDNDDVLFHDSEFEFDRNKASSRTASHTPPPRGRSRIQLAPETRVEDPSGPSKMPSTVRKARFTSPTTCLATHSSPPQREPLAQAQAKGLEEDTYIFSDNYVLPPPRDSFGDSGVILSEESNGVHMSPIPEASAGHKSTKLAIPKTKYNEPLANSLDEAWQGFEPEFIQEFKDLVEFV
jgi:hypothetical protein